MPAGAAGAAGADDAALVEGPLEDEVSGAAADGAVEDGDLAQEHDVGLDGHERAATRAPDEGLAVVSHMSKVRPR